MSEEDKKIEINNKIVECYHKLVKDSKQVAGSNFEQYGDDLLSFCITEFLTKKDVDYQYQVAVIDDKLPNYIGRSMSMQIRSKTSPFYHTHRKSMYNSRGVYLAETGEIDDSEYEDMDYRLSPPKERSTEDCVKWVMETQLDFYERTIIDKIYFQKWTKKRFMEYYGLPNNSFQKDLKKTINKFKTLCNTFT